MGPWCRSLVVAALFLMSGTTAAPYIECPEWVSYNGIVHDLLTLSDAVSSETHDNVQGVCGNYKMEYEREGWYDTRMRIYNSEQTNQSFIVFRPTQQNREGEAIHEGRRMVDCYFLSNCKGKVHDRFQQAFLSLISVPSGDQMWTEHLLPTVFVGGHSLGGAFQLFMALLLWKEYQIIPNMSFGFAGPFFSDQLFGKTYLDEFRVIMNGRWWQVETVDASNPSNFDGTVEGYQVGKDELYIDMYSVCGFYIQPLPIPQQAYGMHDIKQYMLYTTGTDCFP